MKKRILSLLLCFCMVLGLLPVIAFAANPDVTIGNTTLTDGKYYTVINGADPSYALVNQLEEPPTDGTPYLYFNGSILTVTGDVELESSGPSTLIINNDKLTIAGTGSLAISSSGAPAIDMNNSSLSLSEGVDFSAEQTGGAPAINNGSVETEEGYSGDIIISSIASNALLDTLVNLQTSGDISISSESSSPVISTSGSVTLKGNSVSVTNTNGSLVSVVSNPENPDETAISITATGSDLSLTGAGNYPLLATDNITLSANGNIEVENTGNDTNSIAIAGNLTVTEAQDVTVSSSHAQAITGTANITATGDVAISSTNLYAINGLTVNGANDVTVTAVGSPAPAIGGDVAIDARGNIDIQNTGAGVAISATNVSVETNGGRITVQSGGTAPVIDANTAITLKARGNIEVTGTNSVAAIEATSKTLISSNGVIKLTDKNGTSTSITLADGSTISAADGGNASTGLDLEITTPTVDTYYQAGNGYALWKDVAGNATDGYTGTLVLHNATIENTTELIGGVGIGAAQMGIALPKGNITLQVEGENEISSEYGCGIGIFDGNITLSGDGTLNVSGGKKDIDLNTGYTLSFGNSDVKLNGIVTMSDEDDSFITVYGDVTLGQSELKLYGDVTIATGATLTIPEGKILNLAYAQSVTNNGSINNNDTVYLPFTLSAQQVKNLNISGKVILIDQDAPGKEYIYVNDVLYQYQELVDRLDLAIGLPVEATYYKLDSGDHGCYILFTPASGSEGPVITLHDVDNTGYLVNGIKLPSDSITIHLEGVNLIDSIIGDGNIAITGNGRLDTKIIRLNSAATLTIADGAQANVFHETGAQSGTYTYTLYGNRSDSLEIYPDEKLILADGAVLTLEATYRQILSFAKNTTLADNLQIGAGASIVNNSNVVLPQGTTAEQIKNLPLSGTGVVIVPTAYSEEGQPTAYDSYSNEGDAIILKEKLDVTEGNHADKTVEHDGYAWDSENKVLTLGKVTLGEISVPAEATIKTDSPSVILGSLKTPDGTAINLTFSGTAPLTISDGISGAVNGDVITIQGGAQITTGRISIGASGGADGTLNVTGTGTSLTVFSEYGSAVYCEAVNVTNGATLTASNEYGVGVMAMGGDVTVTGGSTLTTNCEYGVYISNGKLEVEANSKLITNGTVAPFCIVDKTSHKTQSDVLTLPGIPDGTQIASVTGTSAGSARSYWSIIPANGSLSVSDENNDVVDLSGAKKGKLTFVKASSGGNDNNGGGNNNNGGGGSGGGSSASASYTLTFEPNGGSKISSVSKVSGTAVDLSGYKPTRDGYDFAGWYSDTALTTKVTSVTLTKSATVYAKWTEKTVQSANPFVDVADSAYYHDAVLWATEKGITSGTTGTTFSPDKICTRAQAVTFLWRAEGSPEPASANCPFTDVSAKDYYYKAVLWAVEKGIVKGTSPTTFSPSATVTRSQSMTFLWRAAGETTSISANPFADVSKDAYYYDAVLWAVEKDITKGTSDTAFSPDGGCTRAQIVTFLYRYMGE